MSAKVNFQANPTEHASIISILTFWWMNSFFAKGNRFCLQESDIFEVAHHDSSVVVTDKLKKAWKNELEYSKHSGKTPSLQRAVLKTYFMRFLGLSGLGLMEETLQILVPLFIRGLLRYFEGLVSISMAYAFATGIFLSTLFRIFIHHAYYLQLQRLGWHMQVALCSLLYQKTLCLSKKAMAETSTGQLISLVSTDLRMFDVLFSFLNHLWLGPLSSVVVTYLLWRDFGPSSLAGLSLVIIVMFALATVGKQFGKARAETIEFSDERIRLTNEVISSMRIIKMYAWEKIFQQLVDDARRKEAKKIFKASILKACNFSLFILTPKLLGFATFGIFVYQGGQLSASLVFSALCFYNVIRVSMGLFFPLAIERLSFAKISLKRLQQFLLLDEVVQSTQHDMSPLSLEHCSIQLNHFSASWKTEEESFNTTLDDLSFEVESGKLLVIVGPVGSGKTSLLNAFLQELPPDHGKLIVKGQAAYASQVPWLFSGTVRDNILFGEEYSLSRYKAVVETCALLKDFQLLENGDKTFIGEKGVSLSGGQKARICLARAVYKEQCGIMLLDDPLSAVDPAVAEQLFNSCICGYLKHKLRVLVTHQIQFLKSADQVLVLKHGCIAGLGTYEELIAQGMDFSSLKKKGEDADLESVASTATIYLSFHHEDDMKFSCRKETPSMLVGSRSMFFSPSVGDLQGNIDENDLAEVLMQSYSVHNAVSKYKVKKRKRMKILKMQNRTSKELLRQMSTQYPISMLEETNTDQSPDIIPMEDDSPIQQGSVSFRVYCQYFGWNRCLLFLIVIIALIGHALFVMGDWWTAVWADGAWPNFLSGISFFPRNVTYATPSGNLSENVVWEIDENSSYIEIDGNIIEDFHIMGNSSTAKEVHHRLDFVVVYAIITGAFALFLYVRSIFQFYYCVQSGVHLHNRMFQAVLRTSVRFFDVTPAGRIMNRFAKDMNQIDEMIPSTFMDFIFVFVTIIIVLVVSVVISWFVAIIIIPFLVYFLYLRQYYVRTSRVIKRWEGEMRSPVFSLISSTMDGITTIRAFNMQKAFEEEFHKRQDMHSSVWFLFITGTRWFTLRLDIISVLFVGFVAYLSVLRASLMAAVDAGHVGFALYYTMTMLGVLQWGTRHSTELENQMTSVERVLEFCDLPLEAPLTKPCQCTPKDWPQYGNITFDNLSYAHFPGGPNVLKRIRLNIEAHEKIGIVGRTGAGKSSLISTLFRFNDFTEGSVIIDGLSIADISLTDLRSAISVIPQDPVLFSGTVRKNLDVFSEYADEQLWSALNQVELKTLVKSFPLKLDSELTESGSNFSVGQRQLLCLARAVLKRNKILLIDEATANVDVRTDRLVQDAIRRNFRHCTVLTIAHRLNTIIDSDRIMVLEAGRVVEFDEPHVLLRKRSGVFKSMVNSSKPFEALVLRELAKQSYEKKRMPA